MVQQTQAVNRQAVIDVAQDLYNEYGEIQVKMIQHRSDIAPGALYRHFDGIEELCDVANVPYNRTKSSGSRTDDLNAMLDGVDYDEDAEYYVYVVTVETDDGEEYTYIGQTKALRTRLGNHAGDNWEMLKVPAGDKFVRKKYQMTEIIELVSVHGDKDAALYAERGKYDEYMLDADDTDTVLGGF